MIREEPDNHTIRDPLDVFHPLISDWFRERFGAPSDVQSKAWPAIHGGSHVLATAPTGSGKTLAAFLCAIDRLFRKRMEEAAQGSVRKHGCTVLYISPLRALNRDVRLNLLDPLREIGARFEAAGHVLAPISVMTRSSDTPEEERRRIRKHPPDILITTPESLNIFLSTHSGKAMFGELEYVILDEVHALAESKRGTHLISAVERLVLESGEFQRIALSATVKPLESVAAWLGGFRPGSETAAREVMIIRGNDSRELELRILEAWDSDSQSEDPEDAYNQLGARLRGLITDARSTLIFTNSRRMSEQITRAMNFGIIEPIAWSHHGSLARELRLSVEERLKKGELKAIVATSSLELGIDVGSVDLVILVQTPFTVSQSLQRIGRADHRFGGTSRAYLVPFWGNDCLYAAVQAGMIAGRDIEPMVPISGALDVLAQVLLSICLLESWDDDELYDFVRRAHPWSTLSRRHFDLVVEMLLGRYADLPIRVLKPRMERDVSGRLRSRSGTDRLLWQGGGTIPDRGYYQLREASSNAIIGELDEEFVWERRIGDQFTLGTQIWKIQTIGHSAVEVSHSHDKGVMIPFWKAEGVDQSFHLARRTAEFLEEAQNKLDDTEWKTSLAGRLNAEDAFAGRLVRHLQRQRDVSKAPLPHRHHILIEEIRGDGSEHDTRQIVMHTFWGGRVNKPLALITAAAFERTHGAHLEFFAGNECILFQAPGSVGGKDLLDLFLAADAPAMLREALEGTGIFGSRFREVAGRALLLPKGDARKRVPLWMNRERAKKLLDAVGEKEDFPLVIETWMECVGRAFDLEAMEEQRREILHGEIRVSYRSAKHPSPFAESVVWYETNQFMYQGDEAHGDLRTKLKDDLFAELINNAALRPALPAKLVDDFVRRLRRIDLEFAPRDSEDLRRLATERGFTPVSQWLELRESSGLDEESLADVESRFRILVLGEGGVELLVEPGIIDGLLRDTDEGRAEALYSYLCWSGPCAGDELCGVFGITQDQLLAPMRQLTEEGRVVAGQLLEGDADAYFCHADNYERLLRRLRLSRRANIAIRPTAALARFLADHHGLCSPSGSETSLVDVLDKLIGVVLPAQLWEEVVLPSRLRPYYPSWLDGIFSREELRWFGEGEDRVGFALAPDLPLVRDRTAASTYAAHFEGVGPEFGLKVVDAQSPKNLSSDQLWEGVWKGDLSADGFAVVRAKLSAPVQPARRGRWTGGRVARTHWYLLDDLANDPASGDDEDSLDVHLADRERVRLLLKRFPLVSRALLEREMPALRWKRLIGVLRLMELSGEILAGRFFEGIDGLQFLDPSALERLDELDRAQPEFWFQHAQDPSSLCACLGEGSDLVLPHRQSGTWLLWHGDYLAGVSSRQGKELDIRLEPDSPVIDRFGAFFRFLLERQVNPLSSVRVQTINGVEVSSSPYSQRLKGMGFRDSYKELTLWP